MSLKTRTEAPELHCKGIDRPLWGGVVQECHGCGHDFHPDTSPNLILCWLCDERAAAEATR